MFRAFCLLPEGGINKKSLIVSLFVIACLADVSFAGETGGECLQVGNLGNSQSANGPFQFLEPHYPNYMIHQWGTPNPDDGETKILKFQFSFKQCLFPINVKGMYLGNMYFAYTQKSLWSVWADSSPFRESNYHPEFFIELPEAGDSGFQLGELGIYDHESNGLAGPTSRGLDRFYWKPRMSFHDLDFWPLRGFDLKLSLKIWDSWTGNRPHNMMDYVGRFVFRVAVDGTMFNKEAQLAFAAMKGDVGDYGNYQIDLFLQLGRNIYLYLQFWDGYAESLLDYGHSATRYGAGVAISKW